MTCEAKAAVAAVAAVEAGEAAEAAEAADVTTEGVDVVNMEENNPHETGESKAANTSRSPDPAL